MNESTKIIRGHALYLPYCYYGWIFYVILLVLYWYTGSHFLLPHFSIKILKTFFFLKWAVGALCLHIVSSDFLSLSLHKKYSPMTPALLNLICPHVAQQWLKCEAKLSTLSFITGLWDNYTALLLLLLHLPFTLSWFTPEL